MKRLSLILFVLLLAAPAMACDVINTYDGACYYEPLQLARMNPAVLGVGVAASAPTPIFSDGFETNDFSAWTSETDTGSQISVGTTTPHAGTYAMVYAYSNAADAYVSKKLANNLTQSYVDLWFRVNDVTAVGDSSGDSQRMFIAYDKSSNVQWMLTARCGTNPYNWTVLRVNYYNDAGIQTSDITLNPSADTWYCVRVQWGIATGAGNNDGILNVWTGTTTCTDSAQVALTNVDNDTKAGVGLLRLGEMGSNDWLTAAGVVFLYDDVAIYSGAP